MAVVENGNGFYTQKRRKSRKKRSYCMPERNSKLPRTETEVRKKLVDWAAVKHPRVEIQKDTVAKLVAKTGKKKIIDTTILGNYKRKSKFGAKKLLIAELEFEEHKRDYSILNDMLMITIPLRKLDYWRNDIYQYWIKIDSDGTPFMINYRHIYENRHELDRMNRQGKWQNDDQVVRIKVAERKSKTAEWPKYVLIGWDSVFKELNKIIRLAGF